MMKLLHDIELEKLATRGTGTLVSLNGENLWWLFYPIFGSKEKVHCNVCKNELSSEYGRIHYGCIPALGLELCCECQACFNDEWFHWFAEHTGNVEQDDGEVDYRCINCLLFECPLNPEI